MIWQTLISPAFSSRLCMMLLHSIWQVALLALFVWCLDLIWKKRSIEQRYTVNVASLLVGLAALPITFMLVNVDEHPTATLTEMPTEVTITESATPLPHTLPNEITTIISPEINGPEKSTPPHRPANIVQTSQIASQGWLPYLPWIVAFYLVGVASMLIRLLVSMIRVNQLSARAVEIKYGPLFEALQSLVNQWSMKILPTLARAEKIVVPTVVGLIRPTILLPASAMSGLTINELEMILTHELAHIRRYDMWINLLQRLAEAVLFFNPALWFLSRRISVLREFCCDEMTCQEQSDAVPDRRVQYAMALLRIVELSKPNLTTNNDLTSLAASGRSPSEVRRRIARILGEPLREPLRFSRSMAFSFTAIALLLICGPALLSTQADTSDNTAKSNTDHTVSESKNKISKSNAEKTFSLDNNVKVLSIGTYDEKPQRWWDSKGILQTSRPFRVRGVSIPVNDNQVGRQLVFRVKGLPKHATVSQKVINIVPSGSALVAFKEKERPEGYYAHVFAANRKLESVDLRVGVASGKWTTKIKMNSDNTDGVLGLSESTLNKTQHIQMSGPFSQKDDIVIIVSHDIQDYEFRCIAIDKQGKTHRPPITANNSISQGAFSQFRAKFRDLELSQIDHFEFQTRAFEYMEIKDLPLYPVKNDQKTVEDKTEKKVDTTAKPKSTDTPQKIAIIIAKHVLLLDGRQIVTWEELEQIFSLMPDTTKLKPAFYITRGARQAGLYQSTKKKIGELRSKFKFTNYSEGSLRPRTNFRYDNIKTAEDLQLDPALKLVGTILNTKGEPVEGAEVALVMPVDKSIAYKTYDMALVQGRIRNRVEHIMTVSDSSGQFELYPPPDQKYYIIALHPEIGFSLKRSDWIQPGNQIKLLAWSRLKTTFDKVPNEQQTVSLRTQINAKEDWPEISINQYWSDLPKDVQAKGFWYQHIPPINQATISRDFRSKDGGGISLPGASVSLLPGEERQIDLGPLSKQQRSQLERMRESFRKRRAIINEKPKKENSKTVGVVQDSKGTPLAGAKLFLKHEIKKTGQEFSYSSSSPGYFWGKFLTTTDQQGRFELQQLAPDSYYLFVIEATDGTRAIVHDLQANQNRTISMPKRRNLFAKIIGDLQHLPKRYGKPFVSIRQRIDFHPASGSRYFELIGGDIPIELTDDGGKIVFRGLAIDLKEGNQKQQVEVSLNYPHGPTMIVDSNPDQDTQLQFDLSKPLRNNVKHRKHQLIGQVPNIKIPGRLIDQSGKPVSAALVWLTEKEKQGHMSSLPTSIANTRSTADGRFILRTHNSKLVKFPKIQNTEFQILVWKSGFAMASQVYHKTQPDQPIEIRLQPEPSAKFWILNADGTPCVDAIVTPVAAQRLNNENSSSYFTIQAPIYQHLSARTNTNGLVQIEGLAQNQPVALQFDKLKFGQQQKYKLYHVQGEQIQAELTLQKTGSIKGRLLLPYVSKRDRSNVELIFNTTSTTSKCWTGKASVHLDDEGRFLVPAIAEGRVKVWVKYSQDSLPTSQLPTEPQSVEPHIVKAGKMLDMGEVDIKGLSFKSVN